MKAKEYQKRKDENLAQWVECLAADDNTGTNPGTGGEDLEG